MNDLCKVALEDFKFCDMCNLFLSVDDQILHGSQLISFLTETPFDYP